MLPATFELSLLLLSPGMAENKYTEQQLGVKRGKFCAAVSNGNKDMAQVGRERQRTRIAYAHSESSFPKLRQSVAASSNICHNATAVNGSM